MADYPRHVICPVGHTVLVQNPAEHEAVLAGTADVHVTRAANEHNVTVETRTVRGIKAVVPRKGK